MSTSAEVTSKRRHQDYVYSSSRRTDADIRTTECPVCIVFLKRKTSLPARSRDFMACFTTVGNFHYFITSATSNNVFVRPVILSVSRQNDVDGKLALAFVTNHDSMYSDFENFVCEFISACRCCTCSDFRLL